MNEAPSPPLAVELIGIDKSFGPVRANRNVTLAIAKGSIHGIVGENGAGKSTLMSILYGFYQADAGEIRIDGERLRIANSQIAIRAGIGMVFQHFMLVDELSVIENVMLGAEGGAWLATGAAKARAALKGFARDYGLDVDPDARIGDLSVGQHQRVEIIKALYRGANVLVLDEPTAVLTPPEARALFKLLAALKGQGKTIILITHKLQEIMAVTDRVSVMRRGEIVATTDTASTSPRELASLMVGREVLLRVEKEPREAGEPILAVEGLRVVDERGVARLDDISFTLRQGEIIGVAGVAGNGQSELLGALSGITPMRAGRISLAGVSLTKRAMNPRALRRAGLLHVPEDRLRMGLVPPFAAFESAALGFTDEARYGRGLLLDQDAMAADLSWRMDDYDVRPRDPYLKTAKFSGGNQQKIVLAREIERSPKVLLVGQPTRGVDIGAIEFIHRRLLALRDAGVAILLVSVELEEIMALSDRILVLCGGRITGERRPESTDLSELGLLMAGVEEMAA
ncbi:MAG: ABC transporter ATP-binding protein [Hyphomicrobiales bacterium]|nr:ABC transporter ATP-binding protein [Hyphomicrobiales bacterium]MBV9432946.1 ABC transporter ATP-binding protein [Hyphomicrobiales bacterium]MBV9738125.1 ABC transporter ATP-binding protein [Hyphomicrobiales bacterium]